MPSWASFVTVVAVANVLAIAAMVFVRHWARRRGIESGPPVVNSWATCAGGLCALLFAFTIVTLWNQGTAARGNVEAESAAIRTVARDLTPSQLPLLRAYVEAAIAEWPQLCGGAPSQDAENKLLTLETFAKPRDKSFADDLYRQLSLMEDARNNRWQTSTASMPGEIWLALIVLSLGMVTVLAFAMPERVSVHLPLMIVIACGVGTLLWVAAVLQFPFCGAKGISPAELVGIAKSHMM